VTTAPSNRMAMEMSAMFPGVSAKATGLPRSWKLVGNRTRGCHFLKNALPDATLWPTIVGRWSSAAHRLMERRASGILFSTHEEYRKWRSVIAEIEDYQVVRELVADLVAVGVEATVKQEVREVVDMVRRLLDEGREDVRQTDLKLLLRVDKSAISRRVADALDAGFLKNLEDRKGRPARLVFGDALPDNCEVLPTPEQLVGDDGLRGCTVDPGDRPPPPGAGQEVNYSKPNKARRLGFPDGRRGYERGRGPEIGTGRGRQRHDRQRRSRAPGVRPASARSARRPVTA
jgi:hypothetical protein